MPLIRESNYRPMFLFRRGHLNTILSNMRSVPRPDYKRHRLELDDGDFLDLDLSMRGSKTLLIASHGLEGSADRDYMRSIVNFANARHWDAIAWNMRGCSGEVNRLYSSYHSGKTEDLQSVIDYAIDHYDHDEIYLIGYSLGGNVTLKYLGERGEDLHPKIKSGAALSVPVELHESAHKLASRENWIYMNRFIRKFRPKLRLKAAMFPEMGIKEEDIRGLRNFKDFDELYTAPAHGYASAEDYWSKASSIYVLENIAVPTLLINSLDDPFLAATSFPYKEVETNDKFFLETPSFGGHVGFSIDLFERGNFWYEKRMFEFFSEI